MSENTELSPEHIEALEKVRQTFSNVSTEVLERLQREYNSTPGMAFSVLAMCLSSLTVALVKKEDHEKVFKTFIVETKNNIKLAEFAQSLNETKEELEH